MPGMDTSRVMTSKGCFSAWALSISAKAALALFTATQLPIYAIFESRIVLDISSSSTMRIFIKALHDYGLGRCSVHEDSYRPVKSDVFQIPGGRGRFQAGEKIIINKIVTLILYSHIWNAKGSDVLKKMGSLGKIRLDAFNRGLHHAPHVGNIVPYHGNTQPSLRRPPASRSDEHIFCSGIIEHGINFVNFPCHQRHFIRFEGFGIHIHDIPDILVFTVAKGKGGMAECVFKIFFRNCYAKVLLI